MVSFQQDFGKAHLVSRIFFSAARAMRAISQAGLYPLRILLRAELRHRLIEGGRYPGRLGRAAAPTT
jgi:hypothetical protein